MPSAIPAYSALPTAYNCVAVSYLASEISKSYPTLLVKNIEATPSSMVDELNLEGRQLGLAPDMHIQYQASLYPDTGLD